MLLSILINDQEGSEVINYISPFRSIKGSLLNTWLDIVLKSLLRKEAVRCRVVQIRALNPYIFLAVKANCMFKRHIKL